MKTRTGLVATLIIATLTAIAPAHADQVDVPTNESVAAYMQYYCMGYGEHERDYLRFMRDQYPERWRQLSAHIKRAADSIIREGRQSSACPQ